MCVENLHLAFYTTNLERLAGAALQLVAADIICVREEQKGLNEAVGGVFAMGRIVVVEDDLPFLLYGLTQCFSFFDEVTMHIYFFLAAIYAVVVVHFLLQTHNGRL